MRYSSAIMSIGWPFCATRAYSITLAFADATGKTGNAVMSQ